MLTAKIFRGAGGAGLQISIDCLLYCYITVNLKLYSFVKIDHGGRQNRKKVAKLFSFHFSISLTVIYIKLLLNFGASSFTFTGSFRLLISPIFILLSFSRVFNIFPFSNRSVVSNSFISLSFSFILSKTPTSRGLWI